MGKVFPQVLQAYLLSMKNSFEYNQAQLGRATVVCIPHPKIKYKIAQIDLTPSINGADIRVSRVIVPEGHRRQGWGTRLMKKFCEALDKENLSCELEPRPYNQEEMSTEELIHFYHKFGFHLMISTFGDGDPYFYMYRAPKS